MLRWTRQLLAVALAACLLTLASAQDNEPAPIDPEQVADAQELIRTLSGPEQALYNAIRYLLRPAFEEELFDGRRYRPAPLPAFESSSLEPFTRLEALRLWAVLDSGLPLTTAADGHLRRFLASSIPDSAQDLGPAAIEMLLCRAALLRDDARSRDALLDRAQRIQKATSESRATTDRDRQSGARWYANVLWRGAIQRAAHDIGEKADTALWEADLRALLRSWDRDDGFAAAVANSRAVGMDSNLLAMAALSLALTAPEGVLKRGTLAMIESDLGAMVAKLDEWQSQWDTAGYSGARVLLINSFADQFSPARNSGKVWRESITNRAVAFPDPRGVISGGGLLIDQLGLVDAGWMREQSHAAETALAVVGLSGGLLRPGKGPLARHSLGSIGRYLHAFSLTHAATERMDGGVLSQRVKVAIDDGCYFIERSQQQDGTFQGVYAAQPGNTAISVLALLHGGYARNTQAVASGIEAMLRQCAKSAKPNGVGTYNAGLVLMALQKFHEPALREAGMFAATTPRDFEKARAGVRKLLPADHAELVDRLVSELNRSMPGGENGGWGYYPLRGHGTERSDNSCSQFAVLGYQAASSLGAQISAELFKKEAARLISHYGELKNLPKLEFAYTSDGAKTAVAYKGEIHPGGWGYRTSARQRSGDSMQMTAAGISSLVVCTDELRARGALDPRLEFEIALRIHGAQSRLAALYYSGERLSENAGAIMLAGSDGSGVYYNLYSVERACEMSGTKRLDDKIDWYEIGAHALVESQHADGSWAGPKPGSNRQGQPHTINTAMAVLFLKRASPPVFTDPKRRAPEGETPDEPRRPVTGPPEKPPEKPQDKAKDRQEPEAG